MSKSPYLPPASTAYLMLEIWGETMAGRMDPGEITREKRKEASRRLSVTPPHVFHPRYGYSSFMPSTAPYSGKKRQKTYKRSDDPDARCFAFLQVEVALDSLGQEHRAWAEKRFVLGTRRITGGQKRERETVSTIRRQLKTFEPETIAEAVMAQLRAS